MYNEIPIPPQCKAAFTAEKINALYYDTVDSTSNLARRLAEEGAQTEDYTLIIADAQSAGRGRVGKSFYSPASTGLYMTLLLPAPEGEMFSLITPICAVCVRGAILDIYGKDSQIKWVNDLYIDGKKICGILAESFFSGDARYVALGVGVNISTADFPPELRDIAGSLGGAAESAEETAALKLALAFSICKRLKEALHSESPREYMQTYRSASCVIGRDMTYTQNGITHVAHALDITEGGELLISVNGEEKVLHSGEISIKLSR